VTEKRFKSNASLQQLYRRLQTLHNMYNHCFAGWHIPTTKCSLMTTAVIGIFGAVKISGPRAINMLGAASLVLRYLGTVFKKLGNVYEDSDEALRQWFGNAGKNKVVRKFITSSPPLRAKVGKFYKVDKMTVVEMLGTVIDSTVNLFLF